MSARRHETGPTHLLAASGDRRTLCGAKDAYPHVLQRFASRHQYPHARCVECYTKADLVWMLDPDL